MWLDAADYSCHQCVNGAHRSDHEMLIGVVSGNYGLVESFSSRICDHISTYLFESATKRLKLNFFNTFFIHTYIVVLSYIQKLPYIFVIPRCYCLPLYILYKCVFIKLNGFPFLFFFSISFYISYCKIYKSVA